MTFWHGSQRRKSAAESPNMRYEIYQDKRGKWCWHAVANNGNIMADGGQGYASEYNCKRALKRFKQQAMYAPVVVK